MISARKKYCKQLNLLLDIFVEIRRESLPRYVYRQLPFSNTPLAENP